MREELTDEHVDADESTDDRVFTPFGVASAVLAALAVAAVVLAVVIWTGHREDSAERAYQTRVLEAAADWTGVLVNMNKDTVDASMQRLHENTIGELNADFDSAVEPYRQLVDRLQTRTTGQVDSVSIETLHHRRPARTADPRLHRRRTPSCRRSPPAPTACWWSRRRSVRTPGARSRRPCGGRCALTSPTWTGS